MIIKILTLAGNTWSNYKQKKIQRERDGLGILTLRNLEEEDKPAKGIEMEWSVR